MLWEWVSPALPVVPSVLLEAQLSISLGSLETIPSPISLSFVFSGSFVVNCSCWHACVRFFMFSLNKCTRGCRITVLFLIIQVKCLSWSWAFLFHFLFQVGSSSVRWRCLGEVFLPGLLPPWKKEGWIHMWGLMGWMWFVLFFTSSWNFGKLRQKVRFFPSPKNVLT